MSAGFFVLQTEQKRQPSKTPANANPDEHIVKAQEAAYRREFLARQRQEREEWEIDVRQKERVARDEWESDMLKDTDKWKVGFHRFDVRVCNLSLRFQKVRLSPQQI